MIGTYNTDDGCQYRVYYEKIPKVAKPELRAICEKSTVREGPFAPFPILEKQIERNLRHNLWKLV